MQKEILVIGDSMLDCYWFGSVERISPEAPIPVVKVVREEFRAGAAANVALNCHAMGAKTHLASVIGNDIYGAKLIRLLGDVSHSMKVDSRTVQKLRIIGKNQQIVRVDIEDECVSLDVKYVDESSQIVVFSDYGKGSLKNIQAMIRRSKDMGKTVLVDPKGHDYRKYHGADIIKPNLDEMRSLVGGWSSEEELNEKAYELIERGQFKAILLTRASNGMTLFRKGKAVSVMSEVEDVTDVTGAGDTAIAAFAVSLSRGHSLERAMRYANSAAGIVVRKFGTSVANEEEVFGGTTGREDQERIRCVPVR